MYQASTTKANVALKTNERNKTKLEKKIAKDTQTVEETAAAIENLTAEFKNIEEQATEVRVVARVFCLIAVRYCKSLRKLRLYSSLAKNR